MAGLEDFRVCFLLEDPFADASKRLDPVLRASYVHHCCSAERDDPLGALKSEAVAHPSLQLFRIDADGLRVRAQRTQRDLYIIDRYDVCASAGEHLIEIHGRISLKNDKPASVERKNR